MKKVTYWRIALILNSSTLNSEVNSYNLNHNSMFIVWSDDWRTIRASGVTVNKVITSALLLNQSSLCTEGVVRTNTDSVITLCGVMSKALLLHQSLMRAKWWLTHYYWMSQHWVRSDDWRHITALVMIACGVITVAIFLHQSSLCSEWWWKQYYWHSHQTVRSYGWRIITSVIIVLAVMTEALIMHQSEICASDDWRTSPASVII